jgi:hypothetical protein
MPVRYRAPSWRSHATAEYLEAVGTQDWNKRIPLKADAIFWIASMTKPVTSVAAMMLAEQGRLDLAAPVYRYLPELEANEDVFPALGMSFAGGVGALLGPRWGELGAWLCDAHRRQRQPRPWSGWQLHVGRPLGHEVL